MLLTIVSLIAAPFTSSENRWPTEAIELAGAIENDGRGLIDEHGPKMGLTAEQIRHLRQATGFVECTDQGGAHASASVVGSTTHILTAAHAFYSNGKARGSLSDCYFQNQEENPVRIKLNFPQAFIGTTDPEKEKNDDYAIVPLVDPSRKISPIAIDPERDWALKGFRLYGVSASEIDFNGSRPGDLLKSIPIIRVFTVRDLSKRYYGMWYVDADIDRGASGGLNFIIDKGTIVAAGIFVAGTDRKNEPYSRSNTNLSIFLRRSIQKKIVEMAGDNVVTWSARTESSHEKSPLPTQSQKASGQTFELTLVPNMGGAGLLVSAVSGTDARLEKGDVIVAVGLAEVDSLARFEELVDMAVKEGKGAVLLQVSRDQQDRFIGLPMPQRVIKLERFPGLLLLR